MIEYDHAKTRTEEAPPSCPMPWMREIAFNQMLGAFIGALQGKFTELNWTMSPSRWYDLNAWALQWCRENRVWQAGHPAFLYVERQLLRRAELIREKYPDIDAMREMEMVDWRDRRPPTAGQLLKNEDWYMPIMRMVVSVLGREISDDDVTESGRRLTQGEAVNVVFEITDDLSKHAHFRYRNAWGWSRPLPWIAFCRSEMMDWRDELAEDEVLPMPDPDDQPFGVGV